MGACRASCWRYTAVLGSNTWNFSRQWLLCHWLQCCKVKCRAAPKIKVCCKWRPHRMIPWIGILYLPRSLPSHSTASSLQRHIFNDQEKEAAKNEICNFLKMHAGPATTDQPQTTSSGHSEVIASASLAYSLWEAYDHLQLSSTDDPNQPLHEQELNSVLERRSAAKIYQYIFVLAQQLEPAATKHLSALPTSVASEQLFSSVGQLYADRRYNLLGDNAEKLLFLSYNIRLFRFDY